MGRSEALETKTPPEMQRVPLENIYLQLCASGIRDRIGFLAGTPDPPDSSSVSFAFAALQDLGALDQSSDDSLSPMGRHLAALPCHPRLGKVLLLGCLLSVPGPVLSICGAMSGRSPLMTTQDTQKRSGWQAERLKLLQELGHRSDHCVWAVLMQLWMTKGVIRRDLCKRFGLSYERMSAAFFERRHLCESLVQAGLLPSNFLHEESEHEPAPPDWSVVRAAVVGGLYPNLVHAEPSSSPQGHKANTIGERNKRMRYAIQQKQLSEKDTNSSSYLKSVNMHPNSLCFGQDQFHCPLLAFYTLQQTTKLYVYDATEASPWALLLFGSQPVWNEAAQVLEVGGWMRFHCEAGELVLPVINAARAAIQAVLARKTRDATPFEASSSPALVACMELVRTGGLGYWLCEQPEWPFLEELRAEGEEAAARGEAA